MVITANEEFLSPEEVGERLGVSVYTVRRWIKTGQLRAFKPGKEYRVQQSDLEEFLRAREVRPKAPRRSPSEPSFNDVLAEQRRQLVGLSKDVLRQVDELLEHGDYEKFSVLPAEEQQRRMQYVERFFAIHQEVLDTLAGENLEEADDERLITELRELSLTA